MATRNFCYENRCIVVTDEDYEYGNLPRLGKSDHDRNYPSRDIEDEDTPDFMFWQPVLTSGYYDGACIDYVGKERDAEYWLGADHYYDTKKDVIDECIVQFNLSRNKLNKILPKRHRDVPFWKWYGYAIDALTEYLANVEEAKVNEYLDKLKEKYGYEECRCVATFSNGEGIYEKIS